MMHPVGPLTPAVYWRRRIVLLVLAVVALFLLMKVVSAFGSSSGSTTGAPSPAKTSSSSTAAGGTTTTPAAPLTITTSSAPARRPLRSATPSGGASSSGATPSTTSSSTSATPPSGTSSKPAGSASPTVTPPACTTDQVRVSALTSQTTYAVGDQPVLGLQATNTASTPCLITLSDATVQLQVYNFETRVWGSDDCPNGGDRPVEQVLAPRVPVTVHVPWAGTTSSPGCKTVRQPVGAGSYTLYATLSGEHGAATSFAFH